MGSNQQKRQISNTIPYIFSLAFHSFSTSPRFCPKGFISFSDVSSSQYAPLRSQLQATRLRCKFVVAPASLPTRKQQQQHLKNFIKQLPLQKSEATTPGCRQTALILGLLDNLSANPTVNITLANFDFPQESKALQPCSQLRSSAKFQEALKCSFEETLIILASLALLRQSKRRQVRQKWPK